MPRFLRRLLVRFGKLVLTIAFLVCAAYLLLRLGPINDRILGFIKTEVEQNTGWQLNARSMDRVSPFALRLRDVELTSPTGTKLNAERISLSFAPYQLLIGRVVFPSISIRDVTIVTNPTNTEVAPLTTPESSWGVMPLGVEVQRFRVTNLRVSEELAKQWLPHQTNPPQSINIRGQMRMNAFFGTAVAEATFEDADHPDHQTICSFSAYHRDNSVRLDTRVAEDGHGLLHLALGAITAYSVELSGNSLIQMELPPYPSEDLLGRWSAKGQFLLFCTHNEDDEADNQPMGMLGDSTSIEGHYQWAPWEGLKLNDLIINSQLDDASLRLYGDLHVDRHFELRNASFKGSIDDLKPTHQLFGFTNQGGLQASGTIQGPWHKPVVDVAIKTIDLEIQGRRLGNLQIQTLARCSPEEISGSASLACVLGSIKTNSTFDVHWNYGPKVEVRNLHGQSTSTSLRGNFDLWLATFLLDGQLEGETGDLSWMLPPNSGFIRGTGSLSLGLSSMEGQGPQAANIQAEINNLNLTDLISDYMHIEAHLDNVFEHPTGQAKVIARELHMGDARLKDLAIETTIPNDNSPWDYRVQANGRWESKFRLMASGQVTPSLEAPHIIVDQFAGRLRGHSFQLTSPISASWAAKIFKVSPVSLKVGEGLIQIKGSYASADEAHLALKAINFPMELLHLLIPQLPMQGTLSGELEAHGPPDNPTATLRLEANRVIIAGDGLLNVPPLQARAEGTVTANILKASADIIGIGDQPVTASAELPVRLALWPFHLAVIPDRPMTAKIDANGEVSPLLQLLVSDTSSLTGQARVALDISGTYQAPLVNGILDLRNCTYEGLDTGCVLRNIQAQFVGRGNELVLTQATADDGGQGSVTGSGVFYLDSENKYPFDLAFNLNRAVVLRRDFIQGTGSGQLFLVGNLESTLLRGNLTANHILITIPKELPTPATSLDITFINAPTSIRPANPVATKAENPVDLDIAIDIPGRAFIRSEDLLSEWNGNITVAGTASTPSYHGELRVMRGDYRVNGKTFQLDKGTISFAGDLEKKTNVYVVASQDIDDYSIEAVLRGPLRSPQLNLRSNPHMSQREILSWLIFGRGLKDVTLLENDQAGQAAVDLSKTDQSNTLGMMARLRRLGIDRIDFNSDDLDHSNMSVKVGKYLCRDVFISLDRGITSDSNQVCIEANLIKHVKLQAQVDDEATGGVRLMWKHDY